MSNKTEAKAHGFAPDIEKIKSIIIESNAEVLIEYSHSLGKRFSQKINNKKGTELSSGQIRSVFDEIIRLKGNDINKLHLVRPKLAYVAGRHGGRVKELYLVLDQAIQLIQQGQEQQFTNFKNFIEAIVAYHKLHGGE